jgi:hypothetical protein
MQMDTLQHFRDARQRLRDRAAQYARMARRSETAGNLSTVSHIQLMHRSDALRYYASYQAYRNAACSIFHALKDTEKEMRKTQVVNTLRAMA